MIQKSLSKAFQNLAERYVSGELTNITKQIFPDSNQKKNDLNNKKNIVNNDNENENNLSKFDTRTSVSKHGNKTMLDKINIPRKITKK